MSGYILHTLNPAKFQRGVERFERAEARAIARLARREARQGQARIAARLATLRALLGVEAAR